MAKGLSLHVGLNEINPAHYGGSNGRLEACVNDAEDMAKLAAAQGFSVMGVLKDAAGTRQAVKDSFALAAAQLQPGDIFFFSYSGHGAFVPDENGDEIENSDPNAVEPDLKDETWCLYDGMLVDDEVYLMWQQFQPGVRIFVLLDCCHSGTAIRNMQLGNPAGPVKRGKTLSDALVKKTWMTNRSFYKDISDATAGAKAEALAGKLGCTVTLISGCQDNQVSIDDWPNGVFTAHLLAAWDGGAFQGSIEQFHGAIRAAMPSDQRPNLYTVGAANAAFAAQRPFAIA
jgi:metacaspase-1